MLREEEEECTLTEEEGNIKKQWELEQNNLKKQLILRDDIPWTVPSITPAMNNNDHSITRMVLRFIGGVDISFNKDNKEGNVNNAVASLVVCSYPDLAVVYEDYHRISMNLPYIPGYLAFREVPHLVKLMEKLRQISPHLEPDAILVDGNGILHPRGFGLASHFGVLCNVPTIGVAKNLLYMDGLTREKIKQWSDQHLKQGGDVFPLVGDSGTIHGAILKPKDNVSKPIYISIGHRLSLETSIQIIKLCCKFRIPEPIRQADLRSRDAIKKINRNYEMQSMNKNKS